MNATKERPINLAASMDIHEEVRMAKSLKDGEGLVISVSFNHNRLEWITLVKDKCSTSKRFAQSRCRITGSETSLRCRQRWRSRTPMLAGVRKCPALECAG